MMTNKKQEKIESAFVGRGFKRNNNLSNSSYVTLEDEKHSVYIFEEGELVWESKAVKSVGADKIFKHISQAVGV